MQHLLTIGAVGSHEWLYFAKELDKDSQKIFKPSGRKWPLNVALKNYPDLVQSVNEASRGYQEYETNARLLQSTVATMREQQKQVAERKQRQVHLQQLLDRWPSYAEWQTLQNYLEKATSFDLTIDEQYQALVVERERNAKALAEAQAAVATVQETLDQTGEFRFYQANQEKLAPLFEQLNEQQKQVQLLGLQETQSAQLAGEKAQLVAQYQWQADELPNPLTDEQRTQLEQAEIEINEATTTSQVLTKQLADLEAQLATQNAAVSQVEPQETPLNNGRLSQLSMLIGAVVFMIGFFLPGVLKGIVVVGLAALGYGGYKTWLNKQTAQGQPAQKEAWQQALAKLDVLQAEKQTKAAALQTQQARLQTMHEQSATLLGQAGYETAMPISQVIGMQHALSRMTQLATTLKRQQAANQTLEAALNTYWDAFDFARDWVGPLQGSHEENLAQVSQFKARITQLTQDLAQSNESYRYYQQQVSRLTATIQKQEAAQTALLAKANLTTAAELANCVANEQQRRANEQRQADLKRQLATDLPALQASDSQEQLRQQAAQITEQVASLTDQLQEQQQVVAQLRVTQAQLVDNDRYQQQRQLQLQEQAKITDLAQEWLAKQLAVDWIQATLKAASQERFPRLLEKATQYFAILTQNRYIKINFDETLMTVLRADQVLFEVGELSQGTAEQLYIALRFAFAEEVADVVSLPLLIDDGFVNFDDQRQVAVWTLLQKLSEANQVIYLTANPRAKDYFEADHWLNLAEVGIEHDS
ncbi:ATP-binding protein [Latilactobacillus graminis]|uniref:ATP-binding protein n=1 Tax=Latilactobacillus graminis TaxID=60519 RepID=UPI001D00114A|nr:hypothetical protein [Latilactobacillus graminis]